MISMEHAGDLHRMLPVSAVRYAMRSGDGKLYCKGGAGGDDVLLLPLDLDLAVVGKFMHLLDSRLVRRSRMASIWRHFPRADRATW